MPAPTTLQVNGRQATVTAEPDTPLLYILRNDLGLNGAKFGCGLGQCGACTVLVEGQPVRSCVTELSAVAGRPITTLDHAS
jgi:nicotinate dehydrogenase subunit A